MGNAFRCQPAIQGTHFEMTLSSNQSSDRPQFVKIYLDLFCCEQIGFIETIDSGNRQLQLIR